MEEFKICTKCLKPLAFNLFGKASKGKHGLMSWCKECDRSKAKAYRQENRQAHNDNVRRHYWRNREEILQKQRLDRNLNAKKTSEENAENYLRHRQKRITYARTYSEKNRTVINAKAAEKYRENADRHAEYAAKRLAELPDSIVANALTKHDNLKPSDIPQELIKLKRAQLLLTRELRRRKK